MSLDFLILKLRVLMDLSVHGPESLAYGVDIFGHRIRIWACLIVSGLSRRQSVCRDLAKGTYGQCTSANHLRSHYWKRPGNKQGLLLHKLSGIIRPGQVREMDFWHLSESRRLIILFTLRIDTIFQPTEIFNCHISDFRIENPSITYHADDQGCRIETGGVQHITSIRRRPAIAFPSLSLSFLREKSLPRSGQITSSRNSRG